MSGYTPMTELLRSRAQTDPDAEFLLEPDGPAATVGQLDERVRQWAAGLRREGVQAEDHVLLMLPTSVSAVSAWLGIAALRAVEVPINTQYRGDMLSYIINDSRSRILIIERAYVAQLAEVLDECPGLELIVLHGEGDAPELSVRTIEASELAAGPPADDLPTVAPHDIAAIIYTSGTTGRSKGVMVPWAQLQETARWCTPLPELGPDDTLFLPFPFYHVTAKIPLFAMLQSGGRAVIRERFSSTDYWDVVAEHNCTFGLLLGGMARMLMVRPETDDDASTPLRLVGMVPVIPDLRDFEKRFGVRVGTIFNMTETSVPIASERWEIRDPASAGKQRPGCDVRIVDEHDYEVPVGATGELIVRTDEPWTLNAGYWGMPEATARAWRNGWFHTGDGFRRDEEGNYYFVDRFKDAIRRRGENISSLEVENLVGQHPAVEMVAAIGVPAKTGEEEVMVIVVRKQGQSLQGAELVEFLSSRMPKFMVPRYVRFIDALPMTPTQKVTKHVLRDAGITPDTWDREAEGSAAASATSVASA